MGRRSAAAEHRAGIRRYAGAHLRALQRYFPNAKILFATTTPPNPNGTMGPNPRSRAEIARYNQAAKAALLPLGAEVDDLYVFLQDWGEAEYADYVHLTERGFERLGRHVAETIRNALNR